VKVNYIVWYTIVRVYMQMQLICLWPLSFYANATKIRHWSGNDRLAQRHLWHQWHSIEPACSVKYLK